MDRLKKVIYIIVGTLTAILLTFSLMKKIGLCAEPEYANASLPMPIGAGYGNGFTEEELQTVIAICEQDRVNSNDSGYPKISVITISEYSQQTGQIRLNCYYAGNDRTNLTVADESDFYTSNITWAWANNNYGGCREIVLNSNLSLDMGWWKSYGSQQINTSAWTTNPNGTPIMLKNQWLTGYPIYADGSAVVYNSTTYFQVKNADLPTHTKGGILVEITENDDIISQELPQIDTTAPSTDTNANWFQKILNALGGIGKRIQNDTLTTGWYLNEIKEGNRNFFLDITALLGTALPSITEKLDAIIGYNREQAQENRDDWLEGYQTSAIKSIADTGHSYRETLSQIGQRNTNRLVFGVWRLEYNGNDLHLIGNYTMPQIFSGQTVQQDISFGWYNQVRSYIVNVFKVLLYVGFGWYILTQVPNMIKGASGPARKIGDETK